MGEIAEMMLEGILCEGCGELFDDMVDGATSPGHPRRCRRCGPINLQTALKRTLTGNAHKNARHNRERHEIARQRKPFECGKCHRLFRTEAGLNQHTHDTHNNPARAS
ncbi:hypothetical protein LJR220_003387 [Bradyrhizobium sp. LjRoot220]|uniref:hypothetical protein n=1 Tax=Bradyrhizobium sp. LjRoot220 TaxID=3342284 RepID=UPI003ECDCB5C